MATDKLYWFTRTIRDRCFGQRVLVDRWRKAQKATANALHLKGVNGRSFDRLIYVKDRDAEEGFWGININQINTFDGSGLPWSVVLLLLLRNVNKLTYQRR